MQKQRAASAAHAAGRAVRDAEGEGKDGQPLCRRVAEDGDARMATPRGTARAQERAIGTCDRGRANGLLKLQHEAGADGAHDARSTTLLALLVVLEVHVPLPRHVEDGAPARARRHAARRERLLVHEDACRLWPARELVRREEEGVLGDQARALRVLVRRVHRQLDRVRRRRRVIPDGEGTMRVQQRSDRIHVREDAGDVGGG